MTAHPQTQPMPGSVPVASPAPVLAEGTARKAKGASRNARIALALSLLVATAGVSFAVGHLTGEEAAGTTTSPFAAGVMPMAAAGETEMAATTGATSSDVSATDPSGAGAGGPGMAAAAAVETDTETEPSVASVTVVEAAQAAPADAPEGAMGGRPDMGGMPGGSEGTVTEIGDSSLTITAADGSEQTFVIDGTTSWMQQAPIDASAIQLGDSVTVEIPFGPGDTDTASTVATQVVVTTTGA